MNKTAPELNGWIKPAKTVLSSGLSYANVSRVYNALSFADRTKLDNDKKATFITFIDGRACEQKMNESVVKIAEQLGAKFIASVRSSYLKPRMKIDWKTCTVQLVELTPGVTIADSKEIAS